MSTAMAKTSRNAPCPCGSGKKFKRCHLRDVESGAEIVAVDLTTLALRERWLLLIEEVHRLLRLPRHFSASDIKAAFQASHVRDINVLYDRIIGTFANPFVLPRQSPHTLGALYLGDVQERKIRQNILRMSLYADEIFVIDPFLNPRFRTPEHNCALVEPEAYILDTYQCTYFLLRMYEWLHSGIVTILLNPANHDMEYRHAVLSASQEHGNKHLNDSDREDFTKDFFDPHVLTEMFSSIPDERLESALRGTFPSLPDDAVAELAEALTQLRKSRPDLPHPAIFHGTSAQMHTLRGGLSPIDAALVCSQLNAFPFAERQSQLSLVNSLFKEPNPLADTWSPISSAFREAPLPFLNEVDTDFAISLRRDGRLNAFRQMLNRLWSAVNRTGAGTSPASVLAFSDEVRGEYERARVEWDAIRLDAAKWGVGAVAGLAAGTFALNLPTLLSAGGLLLGVYENWKKTSAFRVRNPASVLIDLKSRA